VRPNLTVNLGLRYSLQLPRTEKNNLQGSFRPDLAKTFPLATPITLPGGQVVSSVSVPAFAYAGMGGRSKYITGIDYTDFEPRFGFAWSPRLNLFGLHLADQGKFVLRGGYGLSHVAVTGNNRLPNPDFGATTNVSTLATGSSGTVDPTSAIRLSSNTPVNGNLTAQQALNIPSDGLVYLNSLAIPGFVVPSSSKVPYVQSWNLTVQYEFMKNTVLEVAYVGSKGTHLYEPLINLNPRNVSTIEAIESAGGTTNSDTNIADPLGRKDLLGNTLTVPLGSLASQYAGFNHLYLYYNAAGNSIRHGMYVSLNRRVSRGLSFTVNYTYGKSIDDASDASPDKNVLSSGTTSGGAVTYGAPSSLDRSLSGYDIKKAFSSTFIYDLPFGRGRRFLGNLWKPVDAAVGGWTLTGIERITDGFPFFPTISDTNRLSGDLTHTIRPDIVSGVPLVNPLYSPNCKASTLCEPYVNPAAFMRPAKGKLGNAPRTLDIRGPLQQYFDVSLQKTIPFPFGKSETRRIQFRVDALNAFNHPNFRISSGNAGPDFMGLPVEFTSESSVLQPITTAEYNTWATANGQPLASTPQGAAQLSSIRNLVGGFKSSTGALPLDFFHVQLPQGFATTNANTFDIRTLQGFKLFRLRNAYNTGFGQLRELGLPRYIQFGIKIYF
jgi:hypothetical protein